MESFKNSTTTSVEESGAGGGGSRDHSSGHKFKDFYDGSPVAGYFDYGKFI